MTVLQRLKARAVALGEIAERFYRRYERLFPLAFFLAGFTYDSLTLTRIDQLSDNLMLLAYVILSGGLILLIGLIDTGQITSQRILQYAKWYPNALQFLLGSLFSAYVIFYFKSAALSKSLFFVALLLVLLLINEFLHHKLLNMTLLCTLYFFVVFAFLTFFIPVVTHKISRAQFFSSGATAFFITGIIVTTIYRRVFREVPKKLVQTASPMLILFGLMSFFYLANWIPPVPLALKEAGIYHHVSKQDGDYWVQFYRRSPLQFWVKDDSRFQYVPGDTVFCYAAVFAPFEMRADVFYRWQWFDPKKEAYVMTDLLKYRISGGREGGYRGYTYKRNIREGRWRVDIETETGQVLGRIDFAVERVNEHRGKAIVIRK